ncbi:MAG: protein kinase [Planctomyces sp.]|nr:protein kinase [Planctomyces sp.]
MSDSGSFAELVFELAEEFVERYRRGERPRIAEYVERYPHLADQIREIFPAIAMVEKVAIDDESLEQHPGIVPNSELHQIGDYRIIREVGRGGMGIVYEAEQVSLGRRVALKVLSRAMLGDPKHRKRFEREARSAARLHHTNIVPVFGVGEQDGHCYYVMQYIHGQGLDDVLKELRQDTLAWNRKLTLELLRDEAIGLIGPVDSSPQPNPSATDAPLPAEPVYSTP